jgi:predicted protein tyrosine phosphatase
MKTLAICQGGLVRSVSLTSVLRYMSDQDAIAYGLEKGTLRTMQMLCDWADHVVVMQEKFATPVDAFFKKMICVCDVGPDIWSNPLHPDLVAMVTKYVMEWSVREYADGFRMKF